MARNLKIGRAQSMMLFSNNDHTLNCMTQGPFANYNNNYNKTKLFREFLFREFHFEQSVISVCFP